MGTNSDSVLIVDGIESFDNKLLYTNVDVLGDATFWNSVDCDKIEISGRAEFASYLTCDDFINVGNVLLKDRLISRNAVFSGTTECYGNINSDLISVGGSLVADGKINSINVTVSGSLEVNRTMAADKIFVDGVIDSKSKIRALDFKLNYNGVTSKLIKLDCELATITSAFDIGNDYALECDTLTCYSASLIKTKVSHLFCESAQIGKGSYVRRLECHQRPIIEDGAIVDEIIYY